MLIGWQACPRPRVCFLVRPRESHTKLLMYYFSTLLILADLLFEPRSSAIGSNSMIKLGFPMLLQPFFAYNFFTAYFILTYAIAFMIQSSHCRRVLIGQLIK